MNLKRVGLGCVLVMLSISMRARAEMPRQFYFEDYHATTNASVGLQLQLFNSISNGTCLYEDSNAVEVVDGFYATLIGDNPVSGSLTNALAGGETYVQVIIDGVPLSPREPLVPVPYALNAAGVASNTITSSMIATGAITTDKLADDVDAQYVNISGDTMTGNLDMGGNQMTNFSQIVFRRNPPYIARDTYFSNYYTVVFLKGAGLIVDEGISGKGFELGSYLNLKCLQCSTGGQYQTNYIARFATTTNVLNEIRVTGHLNMQGSAISNAVFVGDGAGITNFNPEQVRAWALVNTEEPHLDAMRYDAAGEGWLVANPNNYLSMGLDLIEGNDALPDYLQIKPKWLSNAVMRTGGTMAGVLDLDGNTMTNAIGIYGPTTANASNLIIMAGSRIGGGGFGGTLYLSGGWNGYSGYGNVQVRAPLVATEIKGPGWDTPIGGGISGSNLFIHAGMGTYAGHTGGVLRLAGGTGSDGGTPGWIRLESRVDANGQTISNALFVGDGAGLTNLPATGLTTNEADVRYVQKTGDNVIVGALRVDDGSDHWIEIGVYDGITIGDLNITRDGVFHPEGTSIWHDKIRFSGANDQGQIIMGNETNMIVGLRQLVGDWEATSSLSVGGKATIGSSTDQTNLIVAGWAQIDCIPPQGGISMGVYTNR